MSDILGLHVDHDVFVIDAIYNHRREPDALSVIVLVWRQNAKDYRLYWCTMSESTGVENDTSMQPAMVTSSL